MLTFPRPAQQGSITPRIPFNRRSSANLILEAKRYEGTIRLSTPEIVVTDQGRSLAEEMVLYYAGKEEPIVWD